MNPTQYRIIESLSSNDLAKKVNEAMASGWQLHGPPQMQSIHNSTTIIALRFFQAMVK